MRILILSDLHIKPDSNYDSTQWVNNFCNFIKSKYYPDTLIFILGDIITNDGKNGELAFNAASEIFSYIESELSSVNYKIAFIPGNHDYCNGTLSTFEQFCRRHQTIPADPLLFSRGTTFNFTVENFNFILTDSIREKNYGIAGWLDLAAIRACTLADKENILLMHHSLLFEDSSDHTGIIKQPEAMAFLKQNKIRFLLHGHAHATRNFDINGDCMLFGVGSIGIDNPGIDNEKEQFLEIQIIGNSVEAVVNWLWRGGNARFENSYLYPNWTTEYDHGDLIPRIQYEKPDPYIKRYVLPRDIAESDEITRYFSLDKKTTLFDACLKKRLVLFIANAGLGKTVEMQHLAYAVSVKNPYMRPVFLPLNLYDGESIKEYLDFRVPEYRTVDPNQFILIMDGYDELADPKAFIKALSRYVITNPDTHICISMRSNFLASNSSAFRDFSTFQLLELANTDVTMELRRYGISEQSFFEECNRKNLLKLLQNPFYFNKIIEIYLSDKMLPNQSELIDRFVDIQFAKDTEKFEYFNTMEDSRYEVERALTRFAYGMQLLGYSSCDDKTYQCIIEEKCDRQYIKHSSLTINTSAGHSFGHNIFKEHFIAKYVSRMNSVDIIKQISISGTKYLNPNWFNVLGLILQLNSCKELVEWIQETEPLALTKLESDRVTSELRYSILTTALSDIVKKDMWFRNEVCSEAQLAAFVQSPEAIDLLINHINAPAHFRSLYFSLSVLLHFLTLYGRDERVRQVLVNCYQNTNVPSHERRVAISAIAVLKLNTQEITYDLISKFTGSRASDERLGVYEYLQQSNQCNENVDFLLSGIKYLSYSHQDDEISNGTELFTLIECLNSISDPIAIEKAIRWYSNKDHINIDFYDREKLFSGLFSKASIAYNKGYTILFETVYVFFVNATRQYSRYHISDALKFFSITGTIEIAFARLVTEDSDDRLFMIEDTIQFQPSLVDVFCRFYVEGELRDQEIFRRYTLRHQGNGVLFEKCAEAIRIKTGEELTLAEPPRDYAMQQRKDVQSFFDCLFDTSAMKRLLIQLADIYGNREITYNQMQESRVSHENYPEGTYALEITLIQSGFQEERIIDFVDLIDWDYFFINRICYLFKTENASAYLTISDKQHEVLNEVYQKLEEKLDYHTAFKEHLNSYQLSWQIYDYMILKDNLNLPSPDNYYLGLLEIPCGFVNEQSNVGKKYELIEQYITLSAIVAKIEELAPQEARIWVLEELMFGCKRYRIRSCRDTAMLMCKMSEVSAYNRKNALEYLFEVFGSELIMDEIMPTSDNELFEIIVNMLREVADDRLKYEMIKRYKKEPSPFLLKNLIELNVPEGLQIYINASRESNSIFDCSDGISEVTEAISLIHDISLLPLLLDAVRVRFSGSFKDGSFHTLYSSLQKALASCAKSDYGLVWEATDSLKEELSQNKEAISFCNFLQADMLENNKMSLIKKWSPIEVRSILRNIE